MHPTSATNVQAGFLSETLKFSQLFLCQAAIINIKVKRLKWTNPRWEVHWIQSSAVKCHHGLKFVTIICLPQKKQNCTTLYANFLIFFLYFKTISAKKITLNKTLYFNLDVFSSACLAVLPSLVQCSDIMRFQSCCIVITNCLHCTKPKSQP